MKKNFHLLLFLAAMAGCSKHQSANSDTVAEGNALAATSTASIDAGTVQQNIRGFGGASIRGWIADLTTDQRTSAFSTSSGIGLSVLRVRISPNSSDWAAEKPTIDAAKANGAMVVATAWTAPASMKDNNSLVGGKLLASSYAAYAAHLNSFNSTVGGVSAISITNEPDWVVTYESMNNTASEIAAFISQQGGNVGTKIMGPESLNMDPTFTTNVVNAAGSNLSYICGHIYGRSPYVLSLGKEVWMTEHFTNSNDANGWPDALGVAKEVHDCMNAGWNMYVWWYIRRSYGFLDESGNITKRGYVMAHYSKFVRPGFNKISCTANPQTGVYVTAYKNSANKLVVVIINQNTAVTYQPFSYTGISPTGFTRYKTTSTDNLIQDSFSVSGGSFGINLPASSMTTLVSQ